MVESQRRYQIGFAQVERLQADLFSDSELDQFRREWVPGAMVSRYRRNWRLTRVLVESEELLFGEIGFVNQGTLETLTFDQARQEFVQGDASGGYRVPFCVRKSDLVIAYQLYPGVVRPNTFTGAFEAFWNSSARVPEWRVNSLGNEMSFDAWRNSQVVIERMDVRVARPNPHYSDNDRIESLIEDTEAEYVRLVADAQEGRSLDLQYPLFRQAIDHVLHEYGKAKLTGRDMSNQVSIWIKAKNQVARVLASIVVAMLGEREAPPEAFVEAFAQVGAATTQAGPIDDDEEPEE